MSWIQGIGAAAAGAVAFGMASVAPPPAPTGSAPSAPTASLLILNHGPNTRPASPAADLAPGHESRDRLRVAVLDSAAAERGAPCDADRRAAYLDAVTAYAAERTADENQGGRAARARWSSALDGQVGETMRRQQADGLVGEGEMARAVAAASPEGRFVLLMARLHGETAPKPAAAACPAAPLA